MLNILNRTNEALAIIERGPIHLDDLAKELHTSKIQAGYIVHELRKRGKSVCFKEDTVYIPKNSTKTAVTCAMLLIGIPSYMVVFLGEVEAATIS